MPSIAAIATGDARFNILAAALRYVDAQLPGTNLIGTLAAAATNVTVFAPTDTAFARLAADLGYTGSAMDEAGVTSFLVHALPATTIRDVILYHVSAGAKTLDQVSALDTVQTLNGATIRPDGVTLVDAEPDLINPSLIQTNIHATNGIVHVIDRVLLPFDLPGNDAPTITGIVAASGTYDNNKADFDILLHAVTAAGLAGALDNPAADLTVFAPNDAAFLKLAGALGFTGTSEVAAFDYLVDSLTLLSGGQNPIPLLTNILLYHVAPESLQASQVLGAGSIETLLGVNLGVSGTTLVDRDPDIANPRLIATDIQAANGIVHVIDGVLLPVNLLKSDGSNDVDFVIANNAANLISTGMDNDFVDANGGADIVHAGSGNDVVLGGTGNDRMFGDAGNDLLRGDAGHDLILGGAGNDVITGGAGRDTLAGNAGADVFVFEIGSQRDIIVDFRNGQDRIDLTDQHYTSFAMLQAFADITEHSFGTVIDFGGGERIDLLGVKVSQLDGSDFIFA